MPTRDDKRVQVIERLAGHLLNTGLSQISLRQLAAAADTSDRMLLYYFRDKEDVLTAALTHIAAQLAETLSQELPPHEKLPADILLAKIAALTESDHLQPFMRLWIEVAARSGRAEALYTSIATAIAAGFLTWVEERLLAPDHASKAGQAAMILAMIDGIAVLSVCTEKSVTDGALAAMCAALAKT